MSQPPHREWEASESPRLRRFATSSFHLQVCFLHTDLKDW